MSTTPKILAFAGSTREKSYNKLLVKIAVEGARAAGAEVTLVDLRDYPLPLMDEDLEAREGIPENAKKLKDLLLAHHGLIISAPEYNSSITPLLKNTIDWTSRPRPGETSLAGLAGKVAAIVSASPGALGGLRGLVHLRALLGNIQVLVIPETISVSKAYEAFNEDGTLKDARQQANAENVGKKLVSVLSKLQG